MRGKPKRSTSLKSGDFRERERDPEGGGVKKLNNIEVTINKLKGEVDKKQKVTIGERHLTMVSLAGASDRVPEQVSCSCFFGVRYYEQASSASNIARCIRNLTGNKVVRYAAFAEGYQSRGTIQRDIDLLDTILNLCVKDFQLVQN